MTQKLAADGRAPQRRALAAHVQAALRPPTRTPATGQPKAPPAPNPGAPRIAAHVQAALRPPTRTPAIGQPKASPAPNPGAPRIAAHVQAALRPPTQAPPASVLRGARGPAQHPPVRPAGSVQPAYAGPGKGGGMGGGGKRPLKGHVGGVEDPRVGKAMAKLARKYLRDHAGMTDAQINDAMGDEIKEARVAANFAAEAATLQTNRAALVADMDADLGGGGAFNGEIYPVLAAVPRIYSEDLNATRKYAATAGFDGVKSITNLLRCVKSGEGKQLKY